MGTEYGFTDFAIGLVQPWIDLAITIVAYFAPIVLSHMAGRAARFGNAGSREKSRATAGAVALVVGCVIGGIAISATSLYLRMLEWMLGNMVPSVRTIHSPSEAFWLMLSIIPSAEAFIEAFTIAILYALTNSYILPGIVAIGCPIAAWHSARE